jgi:hypothetical protein
VSFENPLGGAVGVVVRALLHAAHDLVRFFTGLTGLVGFAALSFSSMVSWLDSGEGEEGVAGDDGNDDTGDRSGVHGRCGGGGITTTSPDICKKALVTMAATVVMELDMGWASCGERQRSCSRVSAVGVCAGACQRLPSLEPEG